MKKTVLAMLSLISVTSLANYNLYLKTGANFTDEINMIPYINQHIKKDIDEIQNKPYEEVAFGSIACLNNFIDVNSLVKAYNVNMEVTKDIDNFELGLGMGYNANKATKYTMDLEAYAKAYANQIYENTVIDSMGSGKNEEEAKKYGQKEFDRILKETRTSLPKDFTINIEMPSYNTLPIYVTTKYNFDIKSNIKPYVKADLGYAFITSIKNNGDFSYSHSDGDATTIDKAKEESGYSLSIISSAKLKVNGGLYAGFALGAEYKNFLAEIKAVYTKTTLDYEGEISYKNSTIEKRAIKIENIDKSNVTVGVNLGYKFSF